MHASNSSKPKPGFDYFADHSAPTGSEAQLDGPTEDEIEALRTQRIWQRSLLQTAVAFFALFALIWLLWSNRYWMAYAFTTPTRPLELGNVSTMRPTDIPHNAYVAIEGITEHRGLTQKNARGITLDRREWWYMRLLGSRGVFVSVPPKSKQYSTMMEVHVVGRAVDPKKEASHNSLLQGYRLRFSPQPFDQARIILVGAKPGEHRENYIITILVLVVLFASTAYSVIRTVRFGKDWWEVRKKNTRS